VGFGFLEVCLDSLLELEDVLVQDVVCNGGVCVVEGASSRHPGLHCRHLLHRFADLHRQHATIVIYIEVMTKIVGAQLNYLTSIKGQNIYRWVELGL